MTTCGARSGGQRDSVNRGLGPAELRCGRPPKVASERTSEALRDGSRRGLDFRGQVFPFQPIRVANGTPEQKFCTPSLESGRRFSCGSILLWLVSIILLSMRTPRPLQRVDQQGFRQRLEMEPDFKAMQRHHT